MAPSPPNTGSGVPKRADAAQLTAFCRDCLAPAGEETRCRACASPRIVRHPELGTLTIAHVDCDAFYASVEKRDRPDLRDTPVIVGGERRGVVAACCYVARTYGVHSAMPMFKALKACPGAVVIKPDMDKYARVGREVREAMRGLTPLVEPLSIDEAFLDLSGTQRLHHRSPAESLAAFALRMERDIGITVSVGLSHNKFLAKIASDLNKPRGFSVLGETEAAGFLRGKPVGFIWGVGKSMQERLARDGIRTIAQLQDMELKRLAGRYGALGERLYYLARGEDRRPVSPERDTKSVSSETTFNDDIADLAELERILWSLSEKTARRLKAAGLAGRTVTLKLKTSAFRTITRSRTLPEPTRLAERIFRTARPLLAGAADGTWFRLIGVGVSELADLSEADRGDLVDTGIRKQALAEEAVDKVRDRFGRTALGKGRSFTPGKC